MKVLVIGSQGNMGRRYVAILKRFGHEVIERDIVDKTHPYLNYKEIDKAIVATPTGTHFDICRYLAINKVDYLCEKPVSKDPGEIKELINLNKKFGVDGRWVCNWAFTSHATRFEIGKSSYISYNYYNTGKDGLKWDCIQLAYLDVNYPTIFTDSPIFKAEISGYDITLRDIERSYIAMIGTWFQHPKFLWDMEDALKATNKVLKWTA